MCVGATPARARAHVLRERGSEREKERVRDEEDGHSWFCTANTQMLKNV